MKRQQEVFFHVGLGKVASTFLQQELFPKLSGIHYISPQQYKKSTAIIRRSRESKILVSREFDRQLEEELRWFCRDVPNPGVIICLRRQDDWIASQYRRRVKNGWLMPFNEFIDIEKDAGYWKKDELYYQPRIDLIKEITGREPLVMIYDQLKEKPAEFAKLICDFMQLPVPNGVNFQPVHRSFSDKQLIVLQWFCRTFVRSVPRGRSNKVLHWLLYRPVWAFYHLVLYGAALLPWRWIGKKELIDSKELEEVCQYYEEDWERVRSV